MRSRYLIFTDGTFEYYSSHDTLAEAQEEAENNCHREDKAYIIVKLLGRVQRQKPIPIEWEDYDAEPD